MVYKDYSYECYGGTMTDKEYKTIIDLLESNKPKQICELGSGQSTIIFENYCSKYNSNLYSIEHNSKYKRNNTLLFELIESTDIQILDYYYSNINKYNGFENWLIDKDKFDFVLIDGPYGFGFRMNYNYGRVQLLSFVILNKLSDISTVCVHDTERPNMKSTLKEFELLLEKNNFTFNKTVIKESPWLTIYQIVKNNLL